MVSVILDYLTTDEPVEEILRQYPGLKRTISEQPLPTPQREQPGDVLVLLHASAASAKPSSGPARRCATQRV